MKRISKFLLSGAIILLKTVVYANPISYPGGPMVMLENDTMQNSALVNYTLTPQDAIGYRLLYDRDSQATFHGAQWDHLIKRWNNPDSQANIYAFGAAGVIDEPHQADYDFAPAAMTGLQADWESRRYFVLYENKLKLADDQNFQQFTQTARIGIAPYVAESGALHTWLMVQIDHRPERDDQITTTPLVRFFYSNYLVEAGYNVDDHTPLINATIRF